MDEKRQLDTSVLRQRRSWIREKGFNDNWKHWPNDFERKIGETIEACSILAENRMDRRWQTCCCYVGLDWAISRAKLRIFW
ncbi:unnamed protein product [Caenorhabditis angaria]|uniref:Uncharacterized protein n=1 Tax=Caenorhabditis angaria TaxID=860376 RepID=A0A9P1J163_9PELO|nr:unnamed protein product [Caenorhabditis angaria]